MAEFYKTPMRRYQESDEFEDDDEDNEPTAYRSRRVPQKQLDLSGIDLPDYLKEEATVVYQRLGIETHKGNRQQLVKFACLYIAGLRLNKPQIPAVLAKALNLDVRKTSGANTYINQARYMGLCKEISLVSPLLLVQNFISKNKGLSLNEKKLIQKCEKRWNEVKNEDEFSQRPPLLSAAWLLAEQKICSKTEICSGFGISDSIFKSLMTT